MRILKMLWVLPLCLCLLLTGCVNTVELKERLIVQAAGVDYRDGMFELTLQVFSPQGGGTQSAFDASKLNNQIYQTQGNSILEAIRHIEHSTGKQVFLGSNRIIVVGEETAKEWLPASLNFFNSNHETKPKTHVIISKGRAADLVSLQILQEIIPANSVENTIKSAYSSGFSVRSTMIDVIRSFNRVSESGAVIYMGEGVGFGGRKKPELLGTALLVNDRFAGTLTPMETRGVRWVLGKIESTTIVVTDADGGRYSVKARSTGHRVRVTLENGVPHFSIHLKVSCAVPESLRNDDTSLKTQDLPKLTGLIESEIKQEITMALTRCLKEMHTDVFEFNEYLEKYENAYWEKNWERWPQIMEQVEVDVKTEVTIKSLGLGTSTY